MDFSYKHRTKGGFYDASMRKTDGERVFLGQRTGHGASVWLLSAPGDRHLSLASDRYHLSVASMMTKVHNRLWAVERGHALCGHNAANLIARLPQTTVFTHLELREDPASFADQELDSRPVEAGD